eukprot:g4805.t1
MLSSCFRIMTYPCHALNKVSPREKIQLSVIGPEGAGKTTLCWQLTGSLKAKKGEHPLASAGAKTFGPIHDVGQKGMDVMLHDMGGRDGFRGIWKSYILKSHGIVFVVDASASAMAKAKRALDEIASDPQFQGKPLLIVSNKQDCDDVLGVVRVSKALNVKERGTECYRIIETIATDENTINVSEGGLAWIVDQICGQLSTINKMRHKAMEKHEIDLKKRVRESENDANDAISRRERAIERARETGQYKKGDKIQICLECNDVVATTKSIESSWRPVCESCDKKLKAVYDKKYGKIRCVVCGGKASRKSKLVGWKPVCNTCDTRLKKGETKEQIQATPEVHSSAGMSSVSSLLQNVTGTYATSEGTNEHVRMVGNKHAVFHENADGWWASLTIEDDATVRLEVAENGSTFTGTISETTNNVFVKWSDGDLWTQTKEKGSAAVSQASREIDFLLRICGEWATKQGTSEIVKQRALDDGDDTSEVVEVFHGFAAASAGGSTEVVKWGEIVTAISSKNDDTMRLQLTTTEGDRFEGTMKGRDAETTITWSDGDTWFALPPLLSHVAGKYRTADNSFERVAADENANDGAYKVYHNDDDKESWGHIRFDRAKTATESSTLVLELTDREDGTTYAASFEASTSSGIAVIQWSDGDRWEREMSAGETAELKSSLKLLKKERKLAKKKHRRIESTSKKDISSSSPSRRNNAPSKSPTKVVRHAATKTPCKAPRSARHRGGKKRVA